MGMLDKIGEDRNFVLASSKGVMLSWLAETPEASSTTGGRTILAAEEIDSASILTGTFLVASVLATSMLF